MLWLIRRILGPSHFKAIKSASRNTPGTKPDKENPRDKPPKDKPPKDKVPKPNP
jgi:hypothetical protein